MKVKEYWNKRYIDGGNSGRGSYNEHYEFKIKVINDIIKKYDIKSITDFGCGDGNQIGGLNIRKYLGLDISEEAIKMCVTKYSTDTTKTFEVYNNEVKLKKSDLTMSLDVIYHIFEDNLFDNYMNDLIKYSNNHILIYSSNFNDKEWRQHVRHRRFDQKLATVAALIEHIPNIFPDCPADFYLYKLIK
jgi:predicted TPR repeat methyltransferase